MAQESEHVPKNLRPEGDMPPWQMQTGAITERLRIRLSHSHSRRKLHISPLAKQLNQPPFEYQTHNGVAQIGKSMQPKPMIELD